MSMISDSAASYNIKGLLAMLLGLYASATTQLKSFITLTSKTFVDDVEGGLPLLQEAVLTVLRAMAWSACYSESVECFRAIDGFEEVDIAISANILSVLFVAACSLPFEYVMTQIHKMQPDSEGKYPYTGFLDCAIKTFKVGGPAKFYSEYPNYYGRVSPILIMACFFLNQLQNGRNVVGDGKDEGMSSTLGA